MTIASELAVTERLAALLRGEPVSWADVASTADDFVAACDEQQVTVLVAEHVRALPPSGKWPDAVRRQLAARARAAAARELVVQRELTAVLDALAAADVLPIIIKGTALAYSVYQEPFLRPRVDTDLLIRREEADAVRSVLGGRGYAPPLHCDGELLFCQFPLRRTSAGVEHWLDVHWKISTQSAFAGVLTHEDADAHTVPVPALGAHARTLAADAALVLACVHPVMHHRNVESLLWLYDIHLLAASLSDAEWRRTAQIAVERGVSAVCAHQLRRAQAVLGTPVGDVVLNALAAPTRRELSAAYLREDRGWFDELVANIRGLPRWRDRARLVREIAFPRPAYMFQSYGVGASAGASALLPALYLHRIVAGGVKALAGRK